LNRLKLEAQLREQTGVALAKAVNVHGFAARLAVHKSGDGVGDGEFAGSAWIVGCFSAGAF
jgi:hypothetical protein